MKSLSAEVVLDGLRRALAQTHLQHKAANVVAHLPNVNNLPAFEWPRNCVANGSVC